MMGHASSRSQLGGRVPVKALPDRFLRQAGREVEKARAAAASHWAGSAAGPSLGPQRMTACQQQHICRALAKSKSARRRPAHTASTPRRTTDCGQLLGKLPCKWLSASVLHTWGSSLRVQLPDRCTWRGVHGPEARLTAAADGMGERRPARLQGCSACR